MTPDTPTAWSVYIGTNDVEALAKRVQSAGGTVVAPPFDVGDQGKMAVFQDPTGAFISAWQGTRMGGFQTDAPNSYGWAELNARGIDKAIPFYTSVFGWTTGQARWARDNRRTPSSCSTAQSVAGAWEMNPEVPAEVPSYWQIYFAVDDVDARVPQGDRCRRDRDGAAEGLPRRTLRDRDRPAGREPRPAQDIGALIELGVTAWLRAVDVERDRVRHGTRAAQDRAAGADRTQLPLALAARADVGDRDDLHGVALDVRVGGIRIRDDQAGGLADLHRVDGPVVGRRQRARHGASAGLAHVGNGETDATAEGAPEDAAVPPRHPTSKPASTRAGNHRIRRQSPLWVEMRSTMSFCALICALVDAGLIRTDSAVSMAAPNVVSGLLLPTVSTGVLRLTEPLAKFSQAAMAN